ncbi:MAG: DUF2029 domain-containing protein [Micrococcales bacterium]|nr:DUF2029 domain-containing protein [Micrococcales bacterium]
MPPRIVLWVAFALVHLWLVVVNLGGPGYPLGDVQWVYPRWVEAGLSQGSWVGIDVPWVYPLLALVPIVAASLAGAAAYPVLWLTLVTALDAVAFGMLLDSDEPARPRTTAAGGWLVFLVLLGPIALGRIDAVAVAVAVIALVLLGARPALAGVLLAAAAWVKVWPAALVAAALVALPRRRAILAGAAGLTVGVLAVALLLGAGGNVLSFVTEQTGRGLQAEAPAATPLLIGGALGGAWRPYYDTDILTWQVSGPGVEQVAAASTLLLVLVVLGILLVGGRAARRGVDPTRLLPTLALALVMALIVCNKVGSPQFVAWIAAPVLCGVLLLGPRLRDGFGVPALAALAIAALTQAIYPFFYGELLALQPAMLGVLAARNLLGVAVLVWAVRRLVQLARHAAPVREPLPEGAPT